MYACLRESLSMTTVISSGASMISCLIRSANTCGGSIGIYKSTHLHIQTRVGTSM